MDNPNELYAVGDILRMGPQEGGIHLRKHQISFAERATVFADVHVLLLADPDHSEDEARFLLVGASRVRRILVGVSVERGDRIRIVSARKAERKEREQYEENSRP